MEPLPFRVTGQDSLDLIVTVLRGLNRCTLVTITADYVHAEFRSAVFRFLDDVEFLVDRGQGVDATTRRRWIVMVININILVILSAVVVIWLEQLHTVAATVMVIATAIVIATKEFLLNNVFLTQSLTQD